MEATSQTRPLPSFLEGKGLDPETYARIWAEMEEREQARRAASTRVRVSPSSPSDVPDDAAELRRVAAELAAIAATMRGPRP